MITLNSIVGVPLGVVKRVWRLFFDHGFQRLGHVSHHFDWFPMGGKGFGEELAAGWDVASLGDENIDDLAASIDGPVDASPDPRDFHTGFA